MDLGFYFRGMQNGEGQHGIVWKMKASQRREQRNRPYSHPKGSASFERPRPLKTDSTVDGRSRRYRSQGPSSASVASTNPGLWGSSYRPKMPPTGRPVRLLAGNPGDIPRPTQRFGGCGVEARECRSRNRHAKGTLSPDETVPLWNRHSGVRSDRRRRLIKIYKYDSDSQVILESVGCRPPLKCRTWYCPHAQTSAAAVAGDHFDIATATSFPATDHNPSQRHRVGARVSRRQEVILVCSPERTSANFLTGKLGGGWRLWLPG